MLKKPKSEQLDSQLALKPVRFKEIEECIIKCDLTYVTGGNDKAGRCQCKTNGNNCGNGCLNRATRYECSKKCGMGEACTNRRFQNREYAKLESFETEKKGRGVRALEPISKGTFIIEYVGEIIDDRQHIKRAKTYANDPRHHHFYVMTLASNTYIDATKKGNMARYINHSCDPNAATEKWTVDRRTRIGFFATRDIQADEEIVFDYKFERFGKTAQKCYCGSSNCRGVIGVEAEGRKQSEDKEAKDQSDDYSSCSDDTSSSDDSDLEIEPAIEPVVCTKSSKLKNADQVEDVKPVKSSELNEKWKNSVLKNYRIPKKAPVSIVKIECNDSVEYSQSPQLNHSNTSSSQNSELPAPTRRRKSRFEPIVVQKPSIELTSLTPPKLIQIPTSNASCSNTCSSSSTPSNPDNNGSSTTTTNNNGTVDSFVNSYPQQVKQGNRAKPTQRAYHAFAGISPDQSFVPSILPPPFLPHLPPPYFMSTHAMPPHFSGMTSRVELPQSFDLEQFLISPAPPPPPCDFLQ